MADIIHLRKNPHEEVQELLPWLVNGTLDADEIERVEAHLAGCAECRSELSSERQLASAVASLPLDCESAWERMQERMTREAPAEVRTDAGFLQKRVSIRWAIAAPLAACTALALVFVNVQPRQPAEPQYRALGSAGTVEQANLIVQFQPSTEVADMQRVLESADARLVDGPTDTGAYLLRVDQTKRELALKQLRDSRAIALAEPIDGPPRE